MVFLTRSASPRSTIKVTAVIEVTTSAMRMMGSMLSWVVQVQGRSVVIESETDFAKVAADGLPHLRRPARIGLWVENRALAKHAEDFTDVVVLHLHVGDAPIVGQAEVHD